MWNPLFKYHSCLNKSRILNIPSSYWLFQVCKGTHCQTNLFTHGFFQLRKTSFPEQPKNHLRTWTKNGRTELLWVSQKLTFPDWITVDHLQLSQRESNPQSVWGMESLSGSVTQLYLLIPDSFCVPKGKVKPENSTWPWTRGRVTAHREWLSTARGQD